MRKLFFVVLLALVALAVGCDSKSPTDPGDAPGFSTEQAAPFLRNCYNSDILPGRKIVMDTRADVADYVTDANGLGNIQLLTFQDQYFETQPWEVELRYTSTGGCPVSPCQGGTFPDQTVIGRGHWADDPRMGKFVRFEACLMP